MSWARLMAVIRKEVIQTRRDRRTLSLILILPAMQLLLFGYALNTITDHLPTVVYDQSHSAAARAFATVFQNTGYFDIHLWAQSRDEALRAIDTGTAKVAIMIPSDFGDQVLKGTTATAQLLVDGSDPNVAQTALFAGGLIAQVQTGNVVADTLNRLGSSPSQAGIDLRPVVLYNPRMLSANFMVPGIVGLVVQLQAVLLTAFAVVRERERGTLEQLVVTPITPVELMLGKVLPNVLLTLISVTVSLLLARVLFDVRIAGSLPLLFLLTMPFLLGSLGIGLVISVISKTQSQALQFTMFTLLPSIMLSGFMFAREGMPVFFQILSLLIPMTYELQILRGIILKGVGLAVLWRQALALSLFAVAVIGLAVIRFRKQVD